MVEQSKYDRLLQTNSEDPDKIVSENNGDDGDDKSADDVKSSDVDTVENASKQDVPALKSGEVEMHDDKSVNKDNTEKMSDENNKLDKESEECSSCGGGENGNSKSDIFTDTGKVQKTIGKKDRKKQFKKKSKIGSRWIYLNSK